MKNFKRNQDGFTLIELIVVMIIIGILVLLATPRFIRYIKDANATSLTVDVKVIKDAALYKNLKAYDEVGKETGYPIDETITDKTLDDVTLLADVDEDDWKQAVQETLEDAIGSDVFKGSDALTLADFNVGIIKAEKLHSHIRNTRHDMGDFVVVTDGPAEGEVFYTGIVEDGDNLPHVGLTAPKSKVGE